MNDYRVKLKENETRDKYQNPARELKKYIELKKYKSNGDSNCNWYTWYNHQGIGTGTGGV